MIKLIPISKYQLQIKFGYDAKLVTSLRNIEGSNYNKDTKTNTLIIGKENIDAVRQLVKQYSMVWTDAKTVLMTAKESSLFRILADDTALFPYSTERNADLKQAGYRWNPDDKNWYGGSSDRLQLQWWVEPTPDNKTYKIPEIHNSFSPQGILDELESMGFIADDVFWNRALQLVVDAQLKMNPDGSGFDSDKFIADLSA